MAESRAMVRGAVTITVRDASTGQVVDTARNHNLVTTNGLLLLSNLLAATTSTPSATGWYAMLGTSLTAPSSGQTGLVAANTGTWYQLTRYQSGGGTMYAYRDFTTAEVNGTWSEAGLWYGATGTVNSGTMFARALVQWSKTSGQVATLQWAITISNI